MKSFFYTISLVIFSAIILKPKTPTIYPPPEVIEQQKEIVLREIMLDNLINKIEYNVVIDSISIAEVKQHD